MYGLSVMADLVFWGMASLVTGTVIGTDHCMGLWRQLRGTVAMTTVPFLRQLFSEAF